MPGSGPDWLGSCVEERNHEAGGANSPQSGFNFVGGDRDLNTTIATYTADGVLTRVDFPEGRAERFEYHPDGRLAAIVEVGFGAGTRRWEYTWDDLDLVRIDRPDGTAWRFRYDDPDHPGYMTRAILVGTDGSERIEQAWSWDPFGNVGAT